MPPETELVATLAITIPLPDGKIELLPGQVIAAGEIPAGTLQRMLELEQLISAVELDEAPPTDPNGEGDAPPLAIDALGLPKKLVEKLLAQGLADRDALVAFVQAGDGLGEGFTDTEAAKVFEALQATAPPEN